VPRLIRDLLDVIATDGPTTAILDDGDDGGVLQNARNPLICGRCVLGRFTAKLLNL
jgi:hypothetical protein